MRTLQLDWQHTEQELYLAYRHARHPQHARRLHALWLLRRGHLQAQVAQTLGVHLRTVQRWVAWYRQGGLEQLRQRTNGGARRTATSLTPAQQAAVQVYAATHGFRTQAEARRWIAEQFGVELTPEQVRGWFRRFGLRRKVPRPRAVQADAEAQAAWKKGGLVRR